MTLQNRVDPWGELHAAPERGTLMGNRGGRIHDANRRLGASRWASHQWIACVLEFRGRRREVMAPNRYTELFFLDEATALASGHRPCFECRRADAVAFRDAWMRAFQLDHSPSAGEMDHVLHVERTTRDRGKVTFEARLPDLPAGVMVEVHPGQACLWVGGQLRPWSFAGYALEPLAAPPGKVSVLTPRCIVKVLEAGYQLPDWPRQPLNP